MKGRIYELPPMPEGSTENQLRQLRDYLLRLVMSMNEEAEDA